MTEERDVAALLAALQDEDPAERVRAAKVFGRMADPSPEVVAALRARLQDADPAVQAMAAASLGRLGAREAAGDLAALLRRGAPPGRFWAADALGRLGVAGPDVRDALVAAAEGEDPVAARAARRALALLDRPEGPSR